LDHQWNYVLGLPDPRDPSRTRGLAAFNFNAIWVNVEGKRFTQEFGDEKVGLRALLNQPGGTYWSVFDEKGKGVSRSRSRATRTSVTCGVSCTKRRVWS
jgi:hypothetical protein